MGFFDLFKKKKKIITGKENPTVSGFGVSTGDGDIIMSQYSEFPRYYTINGSTVLLLC